MADVELRTKLLKVLKRIHVITGWNLPADQEYTGLLLDELHASFEGEFDMLNLRRLWRPSGKTVSGWRTGARIWTLTSCATYWAFTARSGPGWAWKKKGCRTRQSRKSTPRTRYWTSAGVISRWLSRLCVVVTIRFCMNTSRGTAPRRVYREPGGIDEWTFVLALNTGRENIYENNNHDPTDWFFVVTVIPMFSSNWLGGW